MILSRKNYVNRMRRLNESARPAARVQRKSQTQANGERTANAVRRWADLLESKDYAPIKTKAAKEATAMLLDNQYRSLTEAATNTSIFGAANGLQGGALTATDGYAPGDNRLPKMLLPMVRRVYPALMSNETVGVQPMPGPVALGFALRYRYQKGANVPADSATKHIHEVGADHAEGTLYSKGRKGVFTKASLKVADDAAAMTVEDAKAEVAAATKEAPASALAVKIDALAKAIGLKDTVSVIPALVSIIADSDYPQTSEVLAVLAEDSKSAVTYPFGYKFVSPAAIAAGTVAFAEVVGVHAGADGKHIFDTLAGSEMGYQKLDNRFTGRADARLGEKLAGGRWQFRVEDTGIAAHMQQFEGTGAVAKTSFGFEKKSVEAGTRRLSTSWTLETEEDLKNTNGIDIQNEATQQMSYELQAEIDREMQVRMLYAALSNNEWSLWDAQLSDARWLGERGKAFYQHLIKMSIRMGVRNRRGNANFIVCTPDVAALLEALDEYVVMPTQTSVNTSNLGTAKVGTLGGGRFNVYVDMRTPVYDTRDYGAGYEDMFEGGEDAEFTMPNYCLLGYKGTESYDAGIIYCPYIPIMIMQATDPHSFEPQVGLMTRYGVLDNLFGSELYYHVIIIDSFSQPGVDSSLRGVYPAGYVPYGVASNEDTSWHGEYRFPVEDQHA